MSSNSPLPWRTMAEAKEWLRVNDPELYAYRMTDKAGWYVYRTDDNETIIERTEVMPVIWRSDCTPEEYVSKQPSKNEYVLVNDPEAKKRRAWRSLEHAVSEFINARKFLTRIMDNAESAGYTQAEIQGYIQEQLKEAGF